MQIKDPIIFLVGAGVGSAVTWFVSKKFMEEKLEAKYEAIYQKEVESTKESFAHLTELAKEKAAEAKDKPSLDIYTSVLKQARETEAEQKRINYSNITSEKPEEEYDEELDSVVDDSLIDETTDTSQPYILKRMPDPNEDPNYTQIEVTYYADGTYADSRDAEMEIEDYIGRKMMDYVENTDKDEIFIRNDELCIDLDIRKDTKTYDEVMFG